MRSMAIVSDQIDIAASTITTARATQFIVVNMLTRLKLCEASMNPLLSYVSAIVGGR